MNEDANYIQVRTTQLKELNSRARAYTTRLWQIPFAFLGLTGIQNATLADKCKSTLLISLIFSTIFGILVILNMAGMYSMLKKAVNDIRLIEQDIHLIPTAEDRPCLNISPLFAIVIIATLIYLSISIILLI